MWQLYIDVIKIWLKSEIMERPFHLAGGGGVLYLTPQSKLLSSLKPKIIAFLHDVSVIFLFLFLAKTAVRLFIFCIFQMRFKQYNATKLNK
jgi:hypothetical protein